MIFDSDTFFPDSVQVPLQIGTVKMAFQPTPADISVIITSPAAAKSANGAPMFLTERRVTPSWTVMQLKGKLETMTGVPPSSQRLRVKVPGQAEQWADNDDQLIGTYGLTKGSEIEVGFLSKSTGGLPLSTSLGPRLSPAGYAA
jgi:hypothetical protein